MKSQDNKDCFRAKSTAIAVQTVIAGLTSKVVIAGLTRNPLNAVKHLLTNSRGLRVKPAMTERPAMTGFLLAFLLFALPCHAQEPTIPLTYQSTMVGYGTSSVYDSYLSPLKYTGENVALYYEQMKMTKLMDSHISAQHLFKLDYSWSKNKPETASYYTGMIEYDYGLHYRFKPVDKLHIFAGTQAEGLLGFVYNTRNGNNPATGKFHLNLNLSVIAAYQIKIKSQSLLLKYQVGVPFTGLMYSPHFGQSYYEIGLGDDGDLTHFASFHNYLAIRNNLSVEIPLNWITLRLAYVNSFYETRINDLDTRIHTNTFFIGVSKNFFTVSGKQNRKNYRNVFE
jgi:hypothetical protein